MPGSVAGLALALERYGTMELRDAIQPAIELARGGFVADWYQALSTARQLEELAAAGEGGRVYLRNGRSVYRPPTGMEEGDRATYPDLARSLELIARDGPSAFYRGEIAQTIHDAMAAHGGLITREDLAAYSVRVGSPLTGTYRGLELAFAPGATGGVTALEILNILEQFPKTAVGWHTPGGLNLRALAVRRAFADRFDSCDPYQCDPDGKGCLTSCQVDEDCAPGLVCNNGGCVQPTPPRTDGGVDAGKPDASVSGPDFYSMPRCRCSGPPA